MVPERTPGAKAIKVSLGYWAGYSLFFTFVVKSRKGKCTFLTGLLSKKT